MTKIITFLKPKGRKQYICCFLQYQILKAKKHINHDEYCCHVKQFILASATHIVISIFFSYTMYYTFHCELPYCTFHVSLSFLFIALESRYCPFKQSSLFRKRSIIGQLNVSAATAENEEQYTFSNIIYIEFQNSYSFFSLLSICY